MSLPVADYIDRAAISGKPVKHKWSQSAAMVALGSDNTAVERKFGAISFRGLLSLAASQAEWIHARFLHLDADQELAYLIDAVWAASIDFRYLKSEMLQFTGDDTNAVHGPIQECKRLLRRITEIYLKVDYGIVRYERSLGSLTNYVLPDTKAFQAWLKRVTAALPPLSTPSAAASGKLDVAKKKTQPRGVVDGIWGNPIPREALDPAFDPKAADWAQLIDELLQAIYTTGNPFLRSPAELAPLGMSGKPYRYSKS